MLELEEALKRIMAAVPSPARERVPLVEAHERVLLENVSSESELPPFDNSAMDGYAVRTGDVTNATTDRPARLHLVGRAAAGEIFQGELCPGQCLRLFTGSALPKGADAVVMQEDTRTEPDQEVLILESARPWENVRLAGEDVKGGATLGQSGDILSAGRLSLLAATGVTTVVVGRQPIVGLLATGSELVQPGQPLGRGQIYESNRIVLAALAQRAGAIPKIFPLVPDDPGLTRAALEAAFHECDTVVSSGGVSVGEMDFVKTAFEQAGGSLEFWRVAIRPGRPFVFGRFGQKLLFGLPGNPVSAFVTFLLLVRPALRQWQGAANLTLPAHQALLGEPLANDGNRRHFLRVRIDGAGKVWSAGAQASHMLSSLGVANGLLDLPPQVAFAAGTTVTVLTWE
jgi:molybdopterin molybdotransferase